MFGFFKRQATQDAAATSKEAATPPLKPPPKPGSEPHAADPLVDAVLMSGVVLPPYPAVLTELDQLMARDDFELALLADVVVRDPSLTAALLRVANSPVFGLRQSVSNLRQAITILGLARVRAVLRSEVLREAMRDYGDPALVQALWLRFSEIGNLAAHLASHSTVLKPQADLAYTTGMFHGTGSFILAKRYPLETSRLALAGADFEAQIKQLDTELGTDHAAIGALVARGWRLPPEVAVAIAHQHHLPIASEATSTTGRLTSLLKLSIVLHDGGNQSDDWPALWEIVQEPLGLDQDSLAEAMAETGRTG